MDVKKKNQQKLCSFLVWFRAGGSDGDFLSLQTIVEFGRDGYKMSSEQIYHPGRLEANVGSQNQKVTR